MTLRVERMDDHGQVEDHKHDLVVLSLGMRPATDLARPAGRRDRSRRLRRRAPAQDRPVPDSSKEGVFVAGTATGPKDIVDTIVEAGAAAAEAALYLENGTRPRRLWRLR